MSRPTPVEAVFGALVEDRFPALRAATEATAGGGRDRDAFVLVKEVVELLRELRPDEDAGAGMDEFVAFVHASFVHWLDGSAVVELDRATLDRLLTDPPALPPPPPPGPHYLQLPARRVWGEPLADEPPEPLDGCFVRSDGTGIECVAVFGLHPTRPGVTVVRADGVRPGELRRMDGSRPFAPTLPGGAEAGLHTVAGREELLELVYRVLDALGGAPLKPGRQTVTVA
jgi:hypothetical protein